MLRLFHGDECLTIPPRETDNVHKYVNDINLSIRVPDMHRSAIFICILK